MAHCTISAAAANPQRAQENVKFCRGAFLTCCIAWSMQQASSNGSGNGGLKRFEGLVSGVLLSIPLWVCIGVAVDLLFQDEPISELQSAILFVAAAVEFVVLRRVCRAWYPRAANREPPVRERAPMRAARILQLKQTLLLLGLVGAYLHYYFWDVQLQIASMRSVTVFV